MVQLESIEELTVILEKLKQQNKNGLSPYHNELLKWTKNVDKRYAWVVLAALWLLTFSSLGPYRIYGLIYAKVTTEGVYTREEAAWPVSMVFTVENIMGPLVSVIIYYLSIRKSMFIGGCLLALANGLTYLSKSLLVDVLLIGVVQGIGYAFALFPMMEVTNSYFLRYRNIALGVCLSGGTLSVFILGPAIKWVLDNYHWRVAYLALGAVGCLIPIITLLIKPNPRPQPPEPAQGKPITNRNTFSRLSARALNFQNSMRRQSIMQIARSDSLAQNITGLKRQTSIVSINPFASTVGLERKISRHLMQSVDGSQGVEVQQSTPSAQQMAIRSKLTKQDSIVSRVSMSPSINQDIETVSLSDIAQESSGFNMSIFKSIIKTPAFHLIWISETTYYWVFSITALVFVDYAIDRGCSPSEADSLLQFQSVGELVGRLGLTLLVDQHFLTNKNTFILVLGIMSVLLVTITQFSGFTALAVISVAMVATYSLVYILLNGLLVDYLGEEKVTLGLGLASCISGALMYFRPMAVGYFRDQHGSYELLFISLGIATAISMLLWIAEPLITRLFHGNLKPAPTENSPGAKGVNMDCTV